MTDEHESAEGIEDGEPDSKDMSADDMSLGHNVSDTDDELEKAYKELFDEEKVYGVTERGDADDYPVIAELASDVNVHGEVHATVEEHDTELEIRQGTASFNYEKGIIKITSEAQYGDTVVAMDSIVDWYKPYSTWD